MLPRHVCGDRSWLAGHRDVAKRFLTASVRARRFMYQDKAATVPIVARATGLTEPVIDRACDQLLGRQGCSRPGR